MERVGRSVFDFQLQCDVIMKFGKELTERSHWESSLEVFVCPESETAFLCIIALMSSSEKRPG